MPKRLDSDCATSIAASVTAAARSFVSGYRRSPTPPASTMTRQSSSNADMPRSAPAKDDARWRSVGSDDAQRQAVHVVHARLHVAEVQTFDHDRAGAEEHVMRRRARRLEYLDRQVIDADDFHTVVHEVPGARLGDADVLPMKCGIGPEARIVRLEQDAHVL